ncbi:MAG TPA: hypothetical protein VK015_05820 [Microbacterium sp.]|nr:hypothetical protein [Microbacterium sp.]
MTNDVRVDAARSFEAGADAYERHRPRYPEQLFDDIRELAGTRWGARLLEIGAGTGRATLALAEREIAADPHVRLAERRGYEWPLEMPTGDYLELLATVSRYALLSAEDCEALFAAIGPLLGASVPLDGSTLLLVVEAA